jgi:hypothetical protein
MNDKWTFDKEDKSYEQIIFEENKNKLNDRIKEISSSNVVVNHCLRQITSGANEELVLLEMVIMLAEHNNVLMEESIKHASRLRSTMTQEDIEAIL